MKTPIDPVSVLADRLCAAEADIRTASDACDIARENREAAAAARAWRPKTRAVTDDDIDDDDVRSVMLSLALANFDECRDSPDELAFYARCIHAYMRDNGSWTRACIDDAAKLIEARTTKAEDVIRVRAEEDGREACARELAPIVSLRATVATVRALRSIEDTQDARAKWLLVQLDKPGNGLLMPEAAGREGR